MTASYSVLAEKLLADAKAAFGSLGDITKVIINGTEFTPEQTDCTLIAIADNWADVEVFALSRIDGVCVLRVKMREAAGATTVITQNGETLKVDLQENSRGVAFVGYIPHRNVCPHFTKEASNGRV